MTIGDATLYSPTRAFWLVLRNRRKPVPIAYEIGDTYPGKWPPPGKWRLVEAELGGIPLWQKIGDAT